MKLTSKNWIAKILCLLLATGIWFLIKSNLGKPPGDGTGAPFAPRGIPVDERTLEPRR